MCMDRLAWKKWTTLSTGTEHCRVCELVWLDAEASTHCNEQTQRIKPLTDCPLWSCLWSLESMQPRSSRTTDQSTSLHLQGCYYWCSHGTLQSTLPHSSLALPPWHTQAPCIRWLKRSSMTPNSWQRFHRTPTEERLGVSNLHCRQSEKLQSTVIESNAMQIVTAWCCGTTTELATAAVITVASIDPVGLNPDRTIFRK